jgi:hypothetical protein
VARRVGAEASGKRETRIVVSTVGAGAGACDWRGDRAKPCSQRARRDQRVTLTMGLRRIEEPRRPLRCQPAREKCAVRRPCRREPTRGGRRHQKRRQKSAYEDSEDGDHVGGEDTENCASARGEYKALMLALIARQRGDAARRAIRRAITYIDQWRPPQTVVCLLLRPRAASGHTKGEAGRGQMAEGAVEGARERWSSGEGHARERALPLLFSRHGLYFSLDRSVRMRTLLLL